jgi:Fe-S-cluster containining protein
MSEREKLTKRILETAPRLGPQDTFRFSCRPGVSCFTNCCGDVNIVLTPYDILRLKNRLGMDSSTFLERHTISPFDKEQKFPVRMLRMRDDEAKSCPFLGTQDEGCTVYEDRPWSCRMYPVGQASPAEDIDVEEGFYFLMREEHCKGFDEATDEWTVASWMQDQGVEPYERASRGFKSIVLSKLLRQGIELPASKMEMFHQAFYDLDRFRAFVLESTFLEKFDVPDDEVERLKADDEALLDFAVRWLRFGLFGDTGALSIKEHIVEAKREDLRRTGKLKD